MPQLWIETWVTQYFWLLVILFFFHFFMVNKVIPSIASILKIRKQLSSNSTNIIQEKDEKVVDIKISSVTESSVTIK